MSFRIYFTLKEIKHIIENATVLDIGNKGESHGDEMMTELTRYSLLYDGFDLPEQNAETFKADRKYEVITCFDVLEHIDNVGLCLDRVTKHLKEKGKFICTVPNFWIKQKENHISMFSKKVLYNRLSKYFREVKIKRINFYRTLYVECSFMVK